MKKNIPMIVCFVTPALLTFLILFVYPVIRTIVMSFFAIEGVADPFGSWEFNGLGNYIQVLNTKIFQISMLNILRIWLLGGVLVLAIALIFAVILTSGVKIKAFWRALIYLPNIISAAAYANMWIYFIFNKRFGFLHNLFAALGLNQLAQIDYMNGSMKFWSMFAAFAFGSVGYYMLIFMSGIERIPQDYYEAATIDGAGKIKQLIHITLPLLKTVLKTVITFWTIGALSFFVWSQMWSPVSTEIATVSPLIHMYDITFGTTGAVSRNAGRGAAVGILMALCIMTVFFLINRLIKEDDLEF